jgi:hypothetical protein
MGFKVIMVVVNTIDEGVGKKKKRRKFKLRGILW